MQKRAFKKRGTVYVVARACERCKLHHKKCNGVFPCERCLEANETCVFPNASEEDVFERITKQNESLKIQKINNEQYSAILQADRQQKMRELDLIQAKIAFVRNKIVKLFSIPNLSTYITWYMHKISAVAGTVVPYPDLDTFLLDDDLLKHNLMLSIIGCGAHIANDVQTAQKCMSEALQFVTDYESGSEKLLLEEISLLYNLAFYGLSINDSQLSANMWKRLNGLLATRVDPGKVSAFERVIKPNQELDESAHSSEDHVFNILTFNLSLSSSVNVNGRSDLHYFSRHHEHDS